MTAAETYTIGKVVQKLKGRYPDLSISKIRYLESQGLLSPIRTKSGYRMYTDDDVRRLDAILKMQSTCYYPLSVIRERLDSGQVEEAAVSETASVTAQQPREERPVAKLDDEALGVFHALDEVPDLCGAPVAFLRTLHELGIVQIVRGPGGKQGVKGYDLPVVEAAYELKRHGLDPRFLKPYVQRANREAPLLKQVLSNAVGRQGNLDDPKVRAVFDSELSRVLELAGQVSDGIVRRQVCLEAKHPSYLKDA